MSTPISTPHEPTSEADLLSPFRLGELKLKNRLVMAAMTRCRAVGNLPTDLMATYYQQRAGAGLIISEASQIDPLGTNHFGTPGIYNQAQVVGWRSITEAVHQAGGLIFLQLWHVGRLSHPALADGAIPVAPSAIFTEGQAYTDTGPLPRIMPRALEVAEIPLIVDQYRRAAQHAQAAGFDGVEIHAANGYLPDQFLQDGSNQRTDQYGGSHANRTRFLLEISRAAISVWGAGRVGVRLSPVGRNNKMGDSDPQATFGYAVKALADLDLAYLHLIEPLSSDLKQPPVINPVADYFRPLYPGPLITCGNYTLESASEIVKRGQADMVALARLFLANPDLAERFRRHAPLNQPDPATFYTAGPLGYTDYPFLEP